MDRTLWPSFALLLTLFGLFEMTDIDLWVQDHCYNFSTGAWLVNAKAPVPRLLFYTGPKALIWAFAIGLLILASLPTRWHNRLPFPPWPRRNVWIVLATLATAPALVATSKATTNVFTPDAIRRYGGYAPYVKVLESYPDNDRPKRRGRGFPAGHASGGFALMALAGLAGTRRGRRIGLSIGLGVGSMMGTYQMLKGVHYLSHTLITALVCWIVFLAYRRLPLRKPTEVGIVMSR
jgi:membrane-associated PAP2 superfamily phosphatase